MTATGPHDPSHSRELMWQAEGMLLAADGRLTVEDAEWLIVAAADRLGVSCGDVASFIHLNGRLPD